MSIADKAMLIFMAVVVIGDAIWVWLIETKKRETIK